MNDSSKLNKLRIKDFLNHSRSKLKQIGIQSYNLDSELILSHAMNVDRTYLHAHTDEVISDDIISHLNLALRDRLKHKPIAYIVGYKEFYGRIFKVNKHTLIPRPESETIIEVLKYYQIGKENHINLLDVGTGSGCLGITSKLEFNNIVVYISDISDKALEVAKINAKNLNADVGLIKSDLMDKVSFKVDIVLANLPYVDRLWQRSPDTRYEPEIALLAEDGGLYLIKRLIIQIGDKMRSHGKLILEADTRQHEIIIDFARKNNLRLIMQENFCLAFEKSN